jgi:hypothetical protein
MVLLGLVVVTFTFSGFQRVKALTGDAAHDLQDWQWQYPIASGCPETSTSTAPQKHAPE